MSGRNLMFKPTPRGGPDKKIDLALTAAERSRFREALKQCELILKEEKMRKEKEDKMSGGKKSDAAKKANKKDKVGREVLRCRGVVYCFEIFIVLRGTGREIFC